MIVSVVPGYIKITGVGNAVIISAVDRMETGKINGSGWKDKGITGGWKYKDIWDGKIKFK